MTRLRHLRAAWLLSCLLACTAPVQALQLDTVESGLTTEEAAASRALLAEAVQRLPDRWKDALQQIRVEWRDDLPASVHGRAVGTRISLRRELLGTVARALSQVEPGTRPAVAAIVHELAHLYDRAGHGTLSRDPRLLDLAGWQVAALRPGRTRNAFTDRSPDAYELSGPREFVAVNLEYFLLDPAYPCRRPAMYRYFAEHFAVNGNTGSCDTALPFVDPGTETEPLLAIDPGRVYAIDYLLAEGNTRPMSRWGHSMLRLVVCAPGRPLGPDCRFDLAHHRVLSFRAFVDDMQISSWRGLTGSYPSRLFLLPLDQVIEEYTRFELRGLQSIPLRLSRGEIASLLERAAQVHWSYDGRYYFVTNNCAFETYKLLHDGVPRLADRRLSGITPVGLLDNLEAAGVADASVLADRAEALRTGYYFEPMSARYQAMFEVARSALSIPRQSVHEWLDADAAARSPWIEQADLRSSAALLLLEQAALRRQELRARDELKRRILGRVTRTGDKAGSARAAARDVLQLENVLTRPALLLQSDGYGIPQADERRSALQRGASLAAQAHTQRAALLKQARQWLKPASRAALEETEANVERLASRLRRLHREQEGLQFP